MFVYTLVVQNRENHPKGILNLQLRRPNDRKSILAHTKRRIKKKLKKNPYTNDILIPDRKQQSEMFKKKYIYILRRK